MSKKSGITITSLIIYVVGLTLFLSFITTISVVFSSSFFQKQGELIISKEMFKINMYFSELAKDSTDASNIGEKLVFNNGDYLSYDGKNILKNDKKILGNVSNILYNVSEKNGFKVLTITVTFSKYRMEVVKQYNFVLGRGYSI